MKDPIGLLYEIQRLMTLKGENFFKIRAFENARENLAGHSDLLERAKAGTLREIPGIGGAIEAILVEYLVHGATTLRDDLLRSLPVGLLELTEIPGLGPKKAAAVIEALDIHSVGELEYACKENRLLRLKGFGPKIQAKILEGIHFRNAVQGLHKYSELIEPVSQLKEKLRAVVPGQMSETGAYRRKLEVLGEVDFLIEWASDGSLPAAVDQVVAEFSHAMKLPVKLHYCSPDRFGSELCRTTGSAAHWQALGSPERLTARTEEEFYQALNLSWIPPEARETGEEVALARSGKLGELLPWDGIRGIFHNHTTRSDGAHSLEEMVIAAEKAGLSYIGISDHSQTAVYAQGLKRDILLEQEAEIREVQKRHPKIRIFWGIESDILADGSLDYEDEVLEKFDFVIASIHSRFKMDRETMTQRILMAIRSPYTRFLGHPTGRLLLGRNGYDVDMPAIIEEAARHDVAIELNSNPARLDLDWRWGEEMRKWGTLTSINPDAHDVDGILDIQFGIAMARKALFSTNQVVNTRTVEQVEKWLRRS